MTSQTTGTSSLGTVTPRGRKFLLVASYGTAALSFGYAGAYASPPPAFRNSLLDALGTHWVWASLQFALALTIVIGQLRGGLGLRATHAVGTLIQSVYLMLWVFSMIFTGTGYFVWEGVAALVIMHAILSRMAWPTRAEVKARKVAL